MKFKIYSIVAAGAIIVALGSCKKDFLDKEPVTQVGPEAAFADAAAAEKLILGAYSGMYNDYHIWDFMTNGDVTSDNAYAGGDNSANIAIDKFNPISTNGNITRDWNYLYSNIKDANIVINNVPDIKDAQLDVNNRRTQILGEASILRAYMYFNLVRLWGAVPLVLALPTKDEEFYPKKASVDQIYAQIIKDLEYGVANAPTTGAHKGIATKGVANALLAKVYATKPSPDWAKVQQYSDAVIAGGYALLSNYDFLWDSQHENNSESIWELQFDGWGGIHGNWMPSVIVGSGWKRFNTPTNDLVAAFDAQNDVVRKNSSISFKNVTSEGWTDDYWSKSNYPYVNKYRADDKTNNYIIRLADIILLKAEALNELSAGGWAQAKTLVDQVRTRAKLSGTTAADQASMRLAIENERRLELAFEGHRWFDLVRTNRAIPVMNAQKDGKGSSLNYNVSEAKILFPIPQDEIDRNPNVR